MAFAGYPTIIHIHIQQYHTLLPNLNEGTFDANGFVKGTFKSRFTNTYRPATKEEYYTVVIFYDMESRGMFGDWYALGDLPERADGLANY